jgi:uncharacterized lipoprotein YmbA
MAQSRADQRLWAMAQSDPRVMGDLQAAMSRADTASSVAPAAASTKQNQPEVELGGQVPRYYI